MVLFGSGCVGVAVVVFFFFFLAFFVFFLVFFIPIATSVQDRLYCLNGREKPCF